MKPETACVAEATPDLKNAFQFEMDFHQAILQEPDAARRQALYLDAYGTAYARSQEFSPNKTAFGTQRAEIEMLRPFLHGKDVIDYGCGYGLSTLALGQWAQTVVGCDILETVITQANERHAALGAPQTCRFQTISPAELPFPADSADVVFASDVIEHLHPEDANNFVNQVYQVLRPGGLFVCITPHKLYGPSDLSKLFLPKGAQSKGFHLKEYDYASLIALLQGGGFRRLQRPWLSPRHLAKIPKWLYQGLYPLCFDVPTVMAGLEALPGLQHAFWLRKLLGLNRSIFLLAWKEDAPSGGVPPAKPSL